MLFTTPETLNGIGTKVVPKVVWDRFGTGEQRSVTAPVDSLALYVAVLFKHNCLNILDVALQTISKALIIIHNYRIIILQKIN